MRFLMAPALAGLSLALAACGGGSVDADADGDGNITSAEMKEAVASAGGNIKPEAGKYSVTSKMIKMEAPGAPPQMAQMMSGAMDNTTEYCLTQEMADRGFEDSIKQGQADNCTVDTFTIDGNDVDMTMTCAEGGGEMKMAMNGTVAPTSSNMNMTMTGSVPELGSVEMQMEVQQERIGACD